MRFCVEMAGERSREVGERTGMCGWTVVKGVRLSVCAVVGRVSVIGGQKDGIEELSGVQKLVGNGDTKQYNSVSYGMLSRVHW
jgi:hypothetical protein